MHDPLKGMHSAQGFACTVSPYGVGMQWVTKAQRGKDREEFLDMKGPLGPDMDILTTELSNGL